MYIKRVQEEGWVREFWQPSPLYTTHSEFTPQYIYILPSAHNIEKRSSFSLYYVATLDITAHANILYY